MPSSYFRKVVDNGGTSAAVTIPAAWLRYYKIQKGDFVQLIVNHEIRIKPLSKKIQELIKAQMEGSER